jgi:hypothetical protein
MDVVRQYLSQLGGLVPAPKAVPGGAQPRRSKAMANIAYSLAAPAPLVPGQMLIPATSWNWPDPITGTANDAQYRFADTVPQSAADGALYSPSSRSFSQGYRAFLDFIVDAKFPSPALLAKARQSAALPAGNPATDPTPPGWTKVTVAGYAQWQPIWELPSSAAAWMAAVASGSVNNPGTVRLALTDPSCAGASASTHLQAQDANGQALALPAAAFDTVAITAACWDQVSIYPGTWFDASMLSLGRSFVPDPAVFFGPAGLMACRVASFYVAWQPTFEFISRAPVPVALQQALTGADTVQALGVSVQPAAAAGAQGGALRLVGTASAPVIVAVLIEVLALA